MSICKMFQRQLLSYTVMCSFLVFYPCVSKLTGPFASLVSYVKPCTLKSWSSDAQFRTENMIRHTEKFGSYFPVFKACSGQLNVRIDTRYIM